MNALAFTGSNFFIQSNEQNRVDAERQRHDLALEQLAQAKQEFEQQHVKCLDYLNQRMQQQLSERTFSNVDEELRVYNEVTAASHELPVSLRREPQWAIFIPLATLNAWENSHLGYILGGTAVVGHLTYKVV